MTAENHAAFAERLRLNPSPPSLLGKLLAFVLSAAMLAAGLMFSLVALAAVALGGLGLAGWLWWKTRQLRRRAPARFASAPPAGEGRVIDGEAVRQPDEPRVGNRYLG